MSLSVPACSGKSGGGYYRTITEKALRAPARRS